MERKLWLQIKLFIEEWLELPWREAMIEIIGGMLFLFTLFVWLIIMLAVA